MIGALFAGHFLDAGAIFELLSAVNGGDIVGFFFYNLNTNYKIFTDFKLDDFRSRCPQLHKELYNIANKVTSDYGCSSRRD